MRCPLVLLGLAAAFTLAFSPAVRRRLFAHPADQPPTPDDWAPKYMIGGRYVTREQFEAYQRADDLDKIVYYGEVSA